MKLYMFRTVPLAIIRSFHCTHSNVKCHTGLLTACEQDQDGTAVFFILPFMRYCGKILLNREGHRWQYGSTNTHSVYVLLTAFPLQQWLPERACTLR